MKVKKFKELNETDTNQIPGTSLDKYYTYYKRWCDENEIEYNFDSTSEEDIINKGKKYAYDNNLPNMNYYQDY